MPSITRATQLGLWIVGVAWSTHFALAHDEVEAPAPPPGPVAYTEETCIDFAVCGRVGPPIPMHITNVHSGLVWRQGLPFLLSFFRFPEYRADDIVDPVVPAAEWEILGT